MKRTKRYLTSLIMCLLICSFLVSCQSGDDQSKFHESVLNVYIRPADKEKIHNVLLDWNDAQIIIEIYETLVSDNGLANCACNYIFEIEGAVLHYHSECGTFQDKVQMKSYKLPDNDAAVVNDIIRRTLE